MAGVSVVIVLFWFFIANIVQGTDFDHYERKRHRSRRSPVTNADLETKLDSIISMLGMLNDKIDSQERRISVLSRQVSNVNCNGESRQGRKNCTRSVHKKYILSILETLLLCGSTRKQGKQAPKHYLCLE